MNGIWIRSQDRRGLCIVTGANIFEQGTREELNAAYRKVNESGNDDAVDALKWRVQDQNARTLGVYANKKRALEVLDEIQHAIVRGTVVLPLLTDFQERRKLTDSIVFEMPLK